MYDEFIYINLLETIEKMSLFKYYITLYAFLTLFSEIWYFS